MKYSLSKYIVGITLPNEIRTSLGIDQDSISIGGSGTYLGEINVHRNNPMWQTNGTPTGGYTHNQSLDKTGTVSVTLNQLSDTVSKLKRIFNLFYTIDTQVGMTITVSDSYGNIIATATDCYIPDIPDQNFAETAGTQTWEFTAGVVDIN